MEASAVATVLGNSAASSRVRAGANSIRYARLKPKRPVTDLQKHAPQDLFLRLGSEQQGIALAPASISRVRCFCFRYVLRVDGDDTSAAPMCGHHHSQRLILAHAEFRLQNYDDEFAGCEVIIDQNDFMQTRPFDLYLILDLGLGGGANHVRTAS
jgi:hypothetical protein